MHRRNSEDERRIGLRCAHGPAYRRNAVWNPRPAAQVGFRPLRFPLSFRRRQTCGASSVARSDGCGVATERERARQSAELFARSAGIRHSVGWRRGEHPDCGHRVRGDSTCRTALALKVPAQRRHWFPVSDRIQFCFRGQLRGLFTWIMVTTTDRKARILESRKKICAPAKLDDELCFYSPQENLEALKHPRVRRWLNFISRQYLPDNNKRLHNILLLLPCTKTKPYLLSPEHLHINASLLSAGFFPLKGDSLAGDYSAHLPAGFSPDVLSLAPLKKGQTVLHRAVISEPLVFVPYQFVY